MKDFSLAICKDDPADHQVINWDDFKLEMEKQDALDAFIFTTSDEATHESLEQRTFDSIFNVGIHSPKCLNNYCLVDHNDDDKLLPCIILLDEKESDALNVAHRINKKPILLKCKIDPADGSMSVERGWAASFDKLRDMMGKQGKPGHFSAGDVARAFGFEMDGE